MGVILSLLPKQIVLPANMAGVEMNGFSNATGKELPKCVCGCGNDAGCCKPPRRFSLAGRRAARMRNKVFRNFALVDFLYTPNTPADFESFNGSEYRNCCGM